ncbi:MAG: acyltransferase family protein, partial [Thermoanaerobaculia bacterium]
MATSQRLSPGASSLPRVPSLDGLRGTAILMVILFHCLLSTPSAGVRRLDRIFGGVVDALAPMAMELFFVISGYLITSILDRTRDADNPLRTFYFRRALRIVPLYYGFLILVLVLLRSLPERFVGAPGSMVWEFSFLTNFALAFHGREGIGGLFPHFWTLAIEEQFYVLWPLLILLQAKRRNIGTCLLVLALSALTRTVLAVSVGMHLFALPFQTSDTIISIFVLTPAHLDGLAAGGAAAFLQLRKPELTQRWS